MSLFVPSVIATVAATGVTPATIGSSANGIGGHSAGGHSTVGANGGAGSIGNGASSATKALVTPHTATTPTPQTNGPPAIVQTPQEYPWNEDSTDDEGKGYLI